VVQASLFLSSFSPLFLLLALRFEQRWLWLPLALLALLGLLLVRRLLRQRGEVTPGPRTFSGLRDEGAQVAGYLASYILPLLAISKPTWRDLLAYGLFLGLYAVVYVNSDLMQVNPVLYLAGFRLYAAESATTGETCYLLVRKDQGRPTSGDLRVSDISENLLLVHPVESA
jgi:hypothetical protein